MFDLVAQAAERIPMVPLSPANPVHRYFRLLNGFIEELQGSGFFSWIVGTDGNRFQELLDVLNLFDCNELADKLSRFEALGNSKFPQSLEAREEMIDSIPQEAFEELDEQVRNELLEKAYAALAKLAKIILAEITPHQPIQAPLAEDSVSYENADGRIQSITIKFYQPEAMLDGERNIYWRVGIDAGEILPFQYAGSTTAIGALSAAVYVLWDKFKYAESMGFVFCTDPAGLGNKNSQMMDELFAEFWWMRWKA